jgi:hypothetical protein
VKLHETCERRIRASQEQQHQRDDRGVRGFLAEQAGVFISAGRIPLFIRPGAGSSQSSTTGICGCVSSSGVKTTGSDERGFG